MAFRVAQETLEALEWPQVIALLRGHCRTAQAWRRLDEAAWGELEPSAAAAAGSDASSPADEARTTPRWGFEPSLERVRERLAETSEARALLDEGDLPPLGATADVGPALGRATKGGVLELGQLLDVRSTLQTLHALARFLRGRAESAPRLAALAEAIEEQVPLEHEIDDCIDAGGEVRDRASPTLADARREISRLSGDLQKRLSRYLQNPDIAAHLSDSYYTVRGDRYVLPVKADARGRVRGIVHDASRTGSTLFIEPEGAVELNNRLKQAELSVAREIDRILRHLSHLVGEAGPSLRASLETLAEVDVAFARGRLAQQMEATCPEVGDDGVLVLPQLRHPLIAPEDCVANDIVLGSDFSVLVLSGPNAGGKTVAMKAVALAALFVRTGLHVACSAGARVDACEHVVADIGDGQDIGENLSTFSAHMASLARVVGSAGRHSLIALDEIGVGTDPGEGAALAQSILERLAEADARVIVTTHYNLLKEMAEVDPRFENACVEFDPETLAPTYRLRVGHPGASSACAVAARMGMPSAVLDRTDALLQREDRQLDRMLAELAASRATLEREQQRAEQLRAEGEAVREEYGARLRRLQERRDELFRGMRDDLDSAFKQAHAEVAEVIAELQRSKSSQQAAAAREKLIDLESKAREAEGAAGVAPSSQQTGGLVPVDWRQIEAGDTVRLATGQQATLVSLPDRKGRVAVRVGSAKMVLRAEQIGRARTGGRDGDGARTADRKRVRVQRADESDADQHLGGGTMQCDLRGQRVDEAIDRLSEAVDRATADGRDGLLVIHGHGTGALRKAVRSHLRRSPLVSRMRPGSDEEGGEGVTLAELA